MRVVANHPQDGAALVALASIDPNARGGGGDELDTYIKDGALNRDLAWVPFENRDVAKEPGGLTSASRRPCATISAAQAAAF